MPLITTKGAASAQGFGEFTKTGEAVYIESCFSTYLYTGNGSTQTITNNIDLSTKGGLVWLKGRSDAGYVYDADTIRGATKYLLTGLTNADATNGAGERLTSFNSNGFTLGTDPGQAVNFSGYTYASWTFRKQPKFFDVVTYTGDGVAGRTVAHNLGSVPGCIIVKKTSAVGNWDTYHRSLGATQAVQLNTTGAAFSAGTNWNNTAPTSTVFTLGTDTGVNENGKAYVAYLFAHNAGGFGLSGTDNVISCGTYSTTGTSDAPIINLGYEPQFVLTKQTNSTGDWRLFDNMRGVATGGVDALLRPNLTNAELSITNYIEFNATGFTQAADVDTGANTYIYIAIRRGPMKVPTSGTSVFSPNTVNAVTGTAVTTGFPVDLQILGKRGLWTSYNYSVVDRLRSVSTNTSELSRQMVTSATTAEITNTTYASLNFNNTGFQVPSTLSSTSSIFLSFQRAPSFLSVIAWSGNGLSSQTISHDLAATPQMVFAYNRTTADVRFVFHNAVGATKYIGLNSNAPVTSSGAWNNTSPTSSILTVGTTLCGSGENFVAHLFASCPGVSKVGSYTGTGAAQTIDCGFPAGARMVLVRRSSSTGDWYLYDAARGMTSGSDPYGLLNNAAGDWTGTEYLLTAATGFSLTSTAPADLNGSGGTFIYLAIA